MECVSVHVYLKVYEYTSMIFCHFKKGNNFCDFLFAFLDNVALSK